MTEPAKWVVSVFSRIMTACGAALAGGAFVWRGWEGDSANDPAKTIMHALTGFVLVLAALHVAFRGFSDDDLPTQQPQPQEPQS